MMPEQHIKIGAVFQVERNVVREVVLHGRAHGRGGEESDQKQQRVQPVAIARSRKGEGNPPAGSGLGMSHAQFAVKRNRARRKYPGMPR